MRFTELKRIIVTSYIIGISLDWFIKSIFLLFPNEEPVTSFLKIFSILSLLILWWSFYFRIGWRLPMLKGILFRPNLNGTWFGTFESRDQTSKKVSGDIAIRIKQDYLRISLNSSTPDYHNFSHSVELKHDETSDIHGLVYVYSQQENNILDTAQRDGACKLTLKLIDNEHWLAGDFWTVLSTHGTIEVRRVSKQPIDSFSEAKKLAERRS